MNEGVVKSAEPSKRMDQLFKVGAHFAYSRTRRHPSASPYIFGVKNKTDIFDLEQVEELLDKALSFVKALGEARATVLFVGGKHEARDIVSQAAESLGMPFVTGRWIGGTLTNFSEIKKRMNRLTDHLEKRAKGEFEAKYTKRERLLIDREIVELQENFGGIVSLKERPKALFVVDPRHDRIAVAEAKTMDIPVIALANSDCDLRGITFPIVGNDAARASIAYFVGEVVAAYREGLGSAGKAM